MRRISRAVPIFVAVVFGAGCGECGEAIKTPSGVTMESMSKPEKCEWSVKNGDNLEVHYVGSLEDGSRFDSTYDRAETFKFQMGVGQVIAGWEEGMVGMCVGEKRKLILPPYLAYGDKGAGDIIPPKATLHFDVELIKAEKGPAPQNVFKMIDGNNDSKLDRDEITLYLQKQVETMMANGGEQGEEARKMAKDQDKLVDEIFSHEDKDKDGIITHEEFSGPKHDEL